MTCASPPNRTRRRIPAFHPVPVAPRADGWSPAKQAAFIGYLAQTRCVAEAARLVGMDKASAYRLRKRPGAAGFAAAWDAALGIDAPRVRLASAKSTGLGAAYRFHAGLLQVVMRKGKYRATRWKNDDNAMLQLLAQCDRSAVRHG
ncbi:hypothetical protein [Aurantiacibacter sp. D1-12]|uniref:hypothetical protein n=1 Tax=Aurantiacibacter sp. D1-12 TaxID=2993658 RepID=UPI00237CEE3E|nr:hypothetical protein [Aurantiacibacter sp. D1-12]MDE1467336.1 hypothetical protein [Aurantiacibacter sp. D1-12]